MVKINQETIRERYKMISSDVKSLFTNESLEKTIDIALQIMYDSKKINTQITRPEMKELLRWCTKSARFRFDNQVYQQNNGVAIGSTLGPVLDGIFILGNSDFSNVRKYGFKLEMICWWHIGLY